MTQPNTQSQPLAPADAYSYLKCLAIITRPPAERLNAAKHLFHIACLLGAARVESELLPFLAELIEGPPTFPLLPPCFAEEGCLPSNMDFQAIEDGVVPAPFSLTKRPATFLMAANAESRVYLLRAVIGASEADVLKEQIVLQLARFVPKLVKPSNCMTLVGILCSAAASADVGLRENAVEVLLKLLSFFDKETLLATGCIDLFIGMATSECPYKKSAVVPLLERVLRILGDKRNQSNAKDLQPLQTEIVKFYFHIAYTASSSVARRVFAATFPKMVNLVGHSPPDYANNVDLGAFKLVTPSTSMSQLKLEVIDHVIVDVAAVFLEDQTAEMRALAVPMLMTTCLMFFKRLVLPGLTSDELKAFPTLHCLMRESGRRPSQRQPPKAEECSVCKFTWPKRSTLRGAFALDNCALFKQLASTTVWPNCETPLSPEMKKANTDSYRAIITNLIRPLINRIFGDDGVVKSVVADALPFIFDLVIAHLPKAEAVSWMESTWFPILVEEDHEDLRGAFLKYLPLHLWLFVHSPLRGALEETQVDESTVLADVVWPQEMTTLTKMPKLMAKIAQTLQSATDDGDVKLKTIAAEVVPLMFVVVEDASLQAHHLVGPLLSLLRDVDLLVVVSAIGALRVLSPRAKDDCTTIPFKKSALLNLSRSQETMSLLADMLIPVWTACLGASTLSQPTLEGTQTSIPWWRVRCVALHFLPALDELFEITQPERYVHDAKNPLSKFVSKVRSCLHDSVASVRHCAAMSLIELNANCLSEDFTSMMFSPLFKAAEEKAPMCQRMAVCLIGEELIRLLGSKGSLSAVRWSESMFDELMGGLSKLAEDPVRNLREMAAEIIEKLLEYGTVEQKAAWKAS